MRIVLVIAVACCAAADAAPGPVRRALLDGAASDAIGETEHARIVQRLRAAAKRLAPARATGMSPLAWPLQPAPSFTPFGYTATANFVDHDARYPGRVQDYACGTRSYDTAAGYNHGGIDYLLWPFPWLLMDAGDVRVVAAAAGTIIEKYDGWFDRSCAIDFGASGRINAVYVMQDDGLTAWYLHMKKGSVTRVPVGARVEAGDYLGLVGSSGPSSTPHLHFQLTDDSSGKVVDPNHGACNAAPERWIVPQPYESPRILGLATHAAEPETVGCGIVDDAPVHDAIHAQDAFSPGDTLWVSAAFGDHRNGDVAEFELKRPDGSRFAHWSFDLADEHLPRPFYSGTAWDWRYALPADAPAGTWSVEAAFGGRTYAHAFTVAPALAPGQRGLSGAWANPATPGQGMLLDVQPGHGGGAALLFGGWFAYDANVAGGQRWYTLQGALPSAGASIEMPIYATTGGTFDAATPTATVAVGSANLRFDDCTHGTLAYRFVDGSARSGAIPLTRLLANASCGEGGDTGAAARADLYSGTWADPSNAGQGLVLDIGGAQRILFGAWYTFTPERGAGDAGAQRWFTLQAALTDGDAIDGIGLYETTGGVFDAAAQVTTTAVGSARLRFANCTSATLDYAFTAGANAGRSGRLDLVRLTAPSPACASQAPP